MTKPNNADATQTEITEEQIVEGIAQVKAGLTPKRAAARGAAALGHDAECDCPDHVIEEAVRAGAANPVGKFDFAAILQLIMQILALFPKKNAPGPA